MTECKYLIAGKCSFTQSIVGISLPTTEAICTHCMTCSAPKCLNKSTASIITSHLLQNNQFDESNPVHFRMKEILSAPMSGPGTELKKLISWFPLPKKTGCSACKSLELKMNRWGPDKCTEKIKYIARKLEVAAKRRSIPFSELLARKLIALAIHKARGDAS